MYRVPNRNHKPNYYVLEMFPYPSERFIWAIFVTTPLGRGGPAKNHGSYNVLHPMGWMPFGLRRKTPPSAQHPSGGMDQENIANMRDQQAFGLSYDWERGLLPVADYYKWTQWMFLLMYNLGLAYKRQLGELVPHLSNGVGQRAGSEGGCWRCGNQR